MTTKHSTELIASLENPFAVHNEREFGVPGQIYTAPGVYEEALKAGWELQQRPFRAAGVKNIQRQHQKNRMTIWERIDYLADTAPTILATILRCVPAPWTRPTARSWHGCLNSQPRNAYPW